MHPFRQRVSRTVTWHFVVLFSRDVTLDRTSGRSAQCCYFAILLYETHPMCNLSLMLINSDVSDIFRSPNALKT